MEKWAIVLGGGGARGPFQIGVWQALRELKINYSIVTGSSVGALNGALMVQGAFDLAQRMWETLTIENIVDFPPDIQPQEFLVFAKKAVEQGGLDISPLEKILRKNIDEKKIRESDIEYGIVTSRFPLLQPVQLTKDEIPEGELIDYMLASASWFPFFTSRKINGSEYIDGAYADNLPAELAVKCGATKIIAVDLQGAGIVHAFCKQIPLIHIRSHWNLGNMFDFTTENTKRNIKLGYLECLKAFHKLEGNAYSFFPGETATNARALKEDVKRICHRSGVRIFDPSHSLAKIQDRLRYRHIDNRFYKRIHTQPTFGQTLTTAAEISGELLLVPPGRIYTLHQFNRILLDRLRRLMNNLSLVDESGLTLEPEHASSSYRTKNILKRLYSIFRDGYMRGGVSRSLRRMALLFPVEYAAAQYLLTLEVNYFRNHKDN